MNSCSNNWFVCLGDSEIFTPPGGHSTITPKRSGSFFAPTDFIWTKNRLIKFNETVSAKNR